MFVTIVSCLVQLVDIWLYICINKQIQWSHHLHIYSDFENITVINDVNIASKKLYTDQEGFHHFSLNQRLLRHPIHYSHHWPCLTDQQFLLPWKNSQHSRLQWIVHSCQKITQLSFKRKIFTGHLARHFGHYGRGTFQAAGYGLQFFCTKNKVGWMF